MSSGVDPRRGWARSRRSILLAPQSLSPQSPGRRWCRPALQPWAPASAAPSSLRPSWPAFFAGAFFAAFAGAFLAALAGGFFAALPGLLRRRRGRFGGAAALAARWQAGPDLDLASTRRAPVPVPRRQAFRRVDPVGLPSGCSFAPVCSRPGSGSHHARPDMALTGHGQCGRQGQRDGHDGQFEQRPRSRHHRRSAVRPCGGQPHRPVAVCQHHQNGRHHDLRGQQPAVSGRVQLARRAIVTAAPNTPPTNNAATHSSDSCENRGSTLDHWPRCSTVSTSAASAPHHSAAARVCTATATPPSSLSARWPVSGRAATPAAAKPATATFVADERGAAANAAHTRPAATALNSPAPSRRRVQGEVDGGVHARAARLEPPRPGRRPRRAGAARRAAKQRRRSSTGRWRGGSARRGIDRCRASAPRPDRTR